MTKSRAWIIVTALGSSLVGGVVVYLALTVPNDLRADALLDTARTEIAAGHPERARTSLTKVIQQYPRTDAAAAATIALVALAGKDRDALAYSISHLRKSHEQQSGAITSLQKRVAALEKPPPPPAAKPAVAKKPTPKKKPPVRRR